MSIDVTKDISAVVWAVKPLYSSTVAGKPTYWVIRDKYCPGNSGTECFTGNCEFAKQYPGTGKGKPCLEFVRRMESAQSVAAAIK